VILCDVLLGKPCTVPGLTSKHPLSEYVKTSRKNRLYLDVDKAKVQKAGFDSVFAPRDTRNEAGVQYDEMIVYDPDQAIPRYIVYFGGGIAVPAPSWQFPISAGGCRTLTASDVGSEESRELHEFNMAAGQYMRLLGKSSRPVTQVDVYESAEVKARFHSKEAEFAKAKKDTKKIWVFHGTASADNVPRICQGGFKVGGQDGHPISNGARYGQGVYSAKGPDAPMGYAQDTGQVILCLALPGTDGKQGVDDSWAPNNDWVIFKTSAQLIPKYVVHYG